MDALQLQHRKTGDTMRKTSAAMLPINRRRALLALAAGSVGLPALANPQAPVRLVVPFTPGTGIDLIARVLAPKLAERFQRPFIVDNKPGASGNIGTLEVVRSTPDGSTLLVTVNTLVMNTELYPKMGYSPVRDLTAISQTSVGQLVLVTGTQSRIADLRELVDYAQKNPGVLNYGSPGAGTPHHLAMELLKSKTRISLTHVSYRGTAPALTDLLGGQIDLMFLPIHVALQHIKAGKLRAIAISSDSPSPLLPTVPPLKTLNLGDMNVDMWYGLLGPKGLAPEFVPSLNDALKTMLAQPDVAKAFESQGMTPQHSTPQAFQALIGADAKRWGSLIKSQGISAE
jgi:tripartite-type tricarboxylate transporter receptor subunit TctC